MDVIDYVLVFNKDNKSKEQRKKYLTNLLVNGLEIEIKVLYQIEIDNFDHLCLYIYIIKKEKRRAKVGIRVG